MLAVLRYDSDPEGIRRAAEVFPRHQRWFASFVADGTVLALGAFGDALADGSMGVFRTRADAERFAAGDPFVLEGVVAGFRILDWNAIGPWTQLLA